MEAVLVTGGTGCIAGRCIVDLPERGYAVRTTVRSLDKERSVRAAVGAPGDRLSFAVADVRRVVMTSAANAASPSSYTEEGVTDETLWTDPDDPTLIPYRRAKTVAEKAAWEFMASYTGPVTLTTILPGAVFGPILSADSIGSVDIVARMLTGAMPGCPRIGLEIVDVRDLADVHVRAMLAPEAAGERFLATGEFTWMREMAQTLRAITVSLGRRNRHSTAKAERVFGWRPRPTAQTVLDCARSLVEHGVV